MRKIRTAALLTALAVSSLTACGGHSRHGGSISDSDEDASFSIEGGDIFTGKPYTVTLGGDKELASSVGTVTKINPVTQEKAGKNQWFFVVPSEFFTGYDRTYEELKTLSVTFSARASDGTVTEYRQDLAAGDPLLPDQWHLYNAGQNPFSVAQDPLKMVDINVIPAWHTILEEQKTQADGTGVYVAIFDDPVDLNHEDIRDQIHDPGIDGGKNYINTGLPLEYLQEDSSYAHGTAVAGIVAASGANGLGGRGIAFNARLTSFDNGDLNESAVLGYMLRMDKLHLVNASWGLDLMTYSNPAVADLYEALYESGIAVIHANGNEFYRNYDPDNPYIRKECGRLNVECEFKQTNDIARAPFVIHVGAMNSLGVRSSYSSTGTNIWVMGFGGEFGYYEGDSYSSANLVTTLTSTTEDWEDWDEDTPWRSESNAFYTAMMNGTSSASPTVTGAAALAYQAKPDMTVSQLRYLLATTARNDEDMPTMALTPNFTESDYVYNERIVYDHGWQVNGAGLRFSNQYGFGLVDAGALVAGALKCDEDPVCHSMAELPEVFISTNQSPCAFSDETEMNVKCVFSGFRDEEEGEETLVNSTLTIDAVTYDMAGLRYLPEGGASYCASITSDDTAVQTSAMYSANSRLQITAASQAGKLDALIKPVYANWDINASQFAVGMDDLKEMVESVEGGIEFAPLEISTSAFYLEHVTEDPDNRFSLSFKSVCKLDLDSLNQHMKIKIYGRR
ncbi:MAG: S8 family serine peptidase [Succinivibrionaceae bacterium]|nr:S8 family serine peptidase [Succinivibrionaceae bacterium]